MLGLAEIPARVVELDDLHRQIAECDENLCGPKLSKADLAMFTRRRKDAYLALHPDTARHVAGAHASNKAQGNAAANLAVAFTTDTAAKTGRSERDIRRDAHRGERVCDEAMTLLRGTPLDTGTFIDRRKSPSWRHT